MFLLLLLYVYSKWNNWEPAQHVDECTLLIEDFFSRHPTKRKQHLHIIQRNPKKVQNKKSHKRKRKSTSPENQEGIVYAEADSTCSPPPSPPRPYIDPSEVQYLVWDAHRKVNTNI